MAIIFKTLRVVLDVVVPFEQAVDYIESAEDAMVDEVTDAFHGLPIKIGGVGPGKVVAVSDVELTGETMEMPE